MCHIVIKSMCNRNGGACVKLCWNCNGQINVKENVCPNCGCVLIKGNDCKTDAENNKNMGIKNSNDNDNDE